MGSRVTSNAVVVVIVLGINVFSSALVQAQQYYQPQCTNVGLPQGRCVDTRCCPPQQAQVQSAPPQMAGAYAAPPQTGEVIGESSGFGIRGMSFTLPAITLELPTIRMPGFFKTRRDAHMQVDAASAPFVQGQPAVYGQMSAGGYQAATFSQLQPNQVQQPDQDANTFGVEENRCTDDAESSSQKSIPPLPPADELGSLTPRERVLLLNLLKERQRVARLELQMQKLTEAVEGNLYALQDANSLFEQKNQADSTPQPVTGQVELEHPWASDASQIRQARFAEDHRP